MNTDGLYLLTLSVVQKNCVILMNENAHYTSWWTCCHKLSISPCNFNLITENWWRVFLNSDCSVIGQLSQAPSGICLPGTELLQSPFRMEFSLGSLSRRYRRSLLHHRRFLRCYRRTLQRCHYPWDDRWQPVWKKNAHLANISYCSVSAKKIIYIIIIKNPPKFTWHAK